MSGARAKLEPWIRRMLALTPLVRRLRVAHVGSGRGGLHLEDVVVPEVRGDGTAGELAADLVDIAQGHATAYQGRQAYQVSAYGTEDEPVGSTAFAVTVETSDRFDAPSEATDSRSFGAMASRHLETMHRQHTQAMGTVLETVGSVLDRLDKRLSAEEARNERLISVHHQALEALTAVRQTEIAIAAKAAEEESDGEVKAALLGIVMQAAPHLLQAAQKALKGFGRRPRRRLAKASAKALPAGKRKAKRASKAPSGGAAA